MDALAAPIEREGGTLETVGGIHVVQLHGAPAAMGRQHALLASEVCGDVVSRYIDGLVAKLIAHAVPPFGGPGAALLKRLFHLRNAGRMDTAVRGLLQGLSDGFGAPPAHAERALFVPDIVHWLAGRSFVPLAVPPMCSSIYANGPATRDGKALYARNFDFFGRGVWNACNALVIMRPKDGLKSCWIAALGAPLGPQGINEAGLAFALHTNFTRDVQTAGVPLFTLCHRVMAQCATIDEAVRCITREPRLCGLSMFLVDTRAGTAAAVGFSARQHEVVTPEDGVLVRTNHYTTPAMQAVEVAPHPWQRNSRGRFRRIHEMLAAQRGELAVDGLPALLADCRDPWEGCDRVTGNILACINTTQSLVLSPEDETLWLASGDHPVAHAEHYTGFNLPALFAGERGAYLREPLPGGSRLAAPKRAALHEYAEAWSEYFDRLDTGRAVFHLRRAAAQLPGEPIFPRMAGLLLMKQRQYTQALPLLRKSAEYPYADALMRAEARLWLARCLDLARKRPEALSEYRAAAAERAQPVSAAAQRHLTHPFTPLQLLEVAPEFIVGTAIARYRGN